MPFSRRRRKKTKVRSLPAPGQLELPLDYSQSEHDARPRSHARSNSTRRPRSLAYPVTSPARRAPPYIVPPSTSSIMRNINEKLHQDQRFSLTLHISTIIIEVNGERWLGYVSAFPSFDSGTEPEPSSCASIKVCFFGGIRAEAGGERRVLRCGSVSLAVARVGPAAKSGKFERGFDPGLTGLASGLTEGESQVGLSRTKRARL